MLGMRQHGIIEHRNLSHGGLASWHSMPGPLQRYFSKDRLRHEKGEKKLLSLLCERLNGQLLAAAQWPAGK